MEGQIRCLIWVDEEMEEKTKVAIVAIIVLGCLQFAAWYMGYNGAITQLVGTTFGLIIGYYFKKTATSKTV